MVSATMLSATITLAVATLSYGLTDVVSRLYTIYFVRLPKMNPPERRVRIALIGAAKIASQGLLLPANRVDSVDIVAIGARSPGRARKLAERWGVPKHGSYEQILADADIDAVYIALINGAHFRWAAAALDAGKHVLCEKPLTSNAAEARQLDALARARSLLLLEGYHNLHHPLAARLRQLVQSDELGRLTHLEVTSGLPAGGAILAALGVQSRLGYASSDKMDASLGGGKFLSQASTSHDLPRATVSYRELPRSLLSSRGRPCAPSSGSSRRAATQSRWLDTCSATPRRTPRLTPRPARLLLTRLLRTERRARPRSRLRPRFPPP